MPLEFHSLSHGPIAFGFFNIETDLLLLEKYFFFAPSFCEMVKTIALGNDYKADHVALPGYVIDRFEDIGNLSGAIQGNDFHGFIGAVYRLFPFPENPAEFKQKANGKADRVAIEAIMMRWGRSIDISVQVETKSPRIAIAEFVLSKTTLQELVLYVWRGGMPRWQDNSRPDYVEEIKDVINGSVSPLFKGFEL